MDQRPCMRDLRPGGAGGTAGRQGGLDDLSRHAGDLVGRAAEIAGEGPAWGLGGENAAQGAQCCRQTGGADCAESDQEAGLCWDSLEAVVQAGCDDAVPGCGL